MRMRCRRCDALPDDHQGTDTIAINTEAYSLTADNVSTDVAACNERADTFAHTSNDGILVTFVDCAVACTVACTGTYTIVIAIPNDTIDVTSDVPNSGSDVCDSAAVNARWRKQHDRQRCVDVRANDWCWQRDSEHA
jgi:hypothetical protein